MTETAERKVYTKILPFLILSSMIFILAHSEECRADIRAGMELSFGAVIPSLFPFLILSDLFLGCFRAPSGTKLHPTIFNRIFGLSDEALFPLLIGCIAGVPIGAKTTAELTKSGLLGEKTAKNLSAYANNISPAFVIAGVGSALFGSLKIGILLCVSQIFAALSCLFFASRFTKEEATQQKEAPHLPSITLVEAIRRASITAITIAGFVTFFSLVTGVFCRCFSSFSLQISTLFEISSACKRASSVYNNAPVTALSCAAFSIGFGGISAAMQSALCMKDAGISFKGYIPRKIFQGILTVFYTFLLTFIIEI